VKRKAAVLGVLALSVLGCGAAGAQNSQGSSNNAGGSGANGFGAKLGHFFGSLANGAGVQGGSTRPGSGSVDTSRWNILGVRLGDSAEAAQAAVKAAYPQAVRIDDQRHYRYGQFATPLLALRTLYVAGKAHGMVRPGVVAQGAGELGDESERLDILYVWPSLGSVVAIRREHLYDSSRRFLPGAAPRPDEILARGLPTADSILKGLTERFGPPDATYGGGGYGGGLIMGGSYPTTTWTWADNPPALRGNRIELCPAIIDRFAALQLGADPSCGTFLIVTVETVQVRSDTGVDQYVERLTETLVDSRAFATAVQALSAYLKTGQDSNAAALKAKAAAAPAPIL
jgi:hypothetical protein